MLFAPAKSAVLPSKMAPKTAAQMTSSALTLPTVLPYDSQSLKSLLQALFGQFEAQQVAHATAVDSIQSAHARAVDKIQAAHAATVMETCYKVFRREILQGIEIEENRFGFEPEITAKVAKLGCRIYEVGISYYGRTYEEGKKIGWRDGVRAIYCIIKYNVFR